MTRSRLRVLAVAPFPPSSRARHGGARATAQLYEALARQHDVGILHLAEPSTPPADDALLATSAFVEAIRVGAERRTARKRIADKLALLRGTPGWANDLRSGALSERLGSIVSSWRPDVIHVDFLPMGGCLFGLTQVSTPRVLVDYDATVRQASDFAHWPWPTRAALAALDSRAWLRFEHAVLGRVDAVVVLTERDRQALQGRRADLCVRTIPLAAQIPREALDPTGGSPSTIVFVGNFKHSPNVEAAMWLGRRVLPALRKDHPELSLLLVGESPPREVLELAGPGLVITGGVSDVTPHLDRAAVVLAPLFSGGGMRIKVLEALAAGKAVVATTRAADGLDVADGVELMLADHADEFIRSVSNLLSDGVRRRALAAAARAWAVRSRGWDSVADQYDALYRSLLRRSPGVAGANG